MNHFLCKKFISLQPMRHLFANTKTAVSNDEHNDVLFAEALFYLKVGNT